MTSWRSVLRERQLAIDAADREELEAKRKYKLTSPSEECIDFDISYGDVRSSEFLSLSTADAEAVLFGTNEPSAQLIPSDGSCEYNTLPVHELSTACCSGVENLATAHREVATTNSSVIEVIRQSSPAVVGDMDELKSVANFAADAESVDSVDFTELDQISSSVIGSPSSQQQQPFESLSSTPEHLVSDSNVLNFTSDCSEVNFADEMPRSIDEAATVVESALDVQSPDPKRSRRRAQKYGSRTKKKHHKAVQKAEATLSNDAVNLPGKAEIKSNDHSSHTSDVHLLSEQWDFDTFHSPLFDEVQHSEMVPDTTVTGDFAAQVLRQPSYLKAVGIRSEHAVASPQPNNCGDIAESAITQGSKGHLSSLASGKTDSKWLYFLLSLHSN